MTCFKQVAIKASLRHFNRQIPYSRNSDEFHDVNFYVIKNNLVISRINSSFHNMAIDFLKTIRLITDQDNTNHQVGCKQKNLQGHNNCGK